MSRTTAIDLRVRRPVAMLIACVLALFIGVVSVAMNSTTAEAKGKPTPTVTKTKGKPAKVSCPTGQDVLLRGTFGGRTLFTFEDGGVTDVSVSITPDLSAAFVDVIENGAHQVSAFVSPAFDGGAVVFDPALVPGQNYRYDNPDLSSKGKGTPWVVCGTGYVAPTPDPTTTVVDPGPQKYTCVFTDALFERDSAEVTFRHSIDGVEFPTQTQTVSPSEFWRFEVSMEEGQTISATVTYPVLEVGTVTVVDTTFSLPHDEGWPTQYYCELTQ